MLYTLGLSAGLHAGNPIDEDFTYLRDNRAVSVSTRLTYIASIQE
jgi:hypothetical protein